MLAYCISPYSGAYSALPVHISVYVGLLYQVVIRSGAVSREQKLPPLLPLVLYNGRLPAVAVLEVQTLEEMHVMLAEQVAGRTAGPRVGRTLLTSVSGEPHALGLCRCGSCME